MQIFCQDGIRVLQHEYLQYFYIQKWMLGDNPRTYGQHYDYFTVQTSTSIDEVNRVVRELLKDKA